MKLLKYVLKVTLYSLKVVIGVVVLFLLAIAGLIALEMILW